MVTGQTEKLSNLEHPAFERPDSTTTANANTNTSTSTTTDIPTELPERPPASSLRLSLGHTRRRSSQGARKLSTSIGAPPNMVTYPGSTRLEIPSYARDIISKMIVVNPFRRAELIEVAAKVPKEVLMKDTRPLMELAWLDYKSHVGPYAGLGVGVPELDSSASSVYSGVSSMSNPFAGLLGGRRKSSRANTAFGGYYA